MAHAIHRTHLIGLEAATIAMTFNTIIPTTATIPTAMTVLIENDEKAEQEKAEREEVGIGASTPRMKVYIHRMMMTMYLMIGDVEVGRENTSRREIDSTEIECERAMNVLRGIVRLKART